MREPAELPADLLDGLLDGRLAASREPEDASSAIRIAHVAQLADRGEHAAAAQEAAGLIAAGIPDVRVIGFYLFGSFLQRGIAYLPALLGRVAALVADDLAALRPGRRKHQVVNSATAWLFEHVSTQLVFHSRHRDATWEAWCAGGDSALPDAVAAGCTKLTLALEAVVDAPLAAVPLARVRRWALEDLRRASIRREAVAERALPPEAAVSDAADEMADDADDADDDTDDAADTADDADDAADDAASDRIDDAPDLSADPAVAASADRADCDPVRTSSVDAPVAVGSPALAVLQAKLAGFQSLVARGELARAAVVAGDLRAVLAGFDPLAYFPAMFAAYFKTLHQVIDELAPYLERADLPSWHALDSYYRADLRAFLED